MIILIVNDEKAFASSMRALRRMPTDFWQIAAELVGADAITNPVPSTQKITAAFTDMDVFRNDTAFEEYQPE